MIIFKLCTQKNPSRFKPGVIYPLKLLRFRTVFDIFVKNEEAHTGKITKQQTLFLNFSLLLDKRQAFQLNFV